MNKRDYYEVLELTPSCTPHDVRQSYRKLALKWHPDKCFNTPGAKNKFSEIHEAYTVLSDERKKGIYDKHGHQGIDYDQECNGDPNTSKKNFFFEKGFQGTDKSAFDILKDIFSENDDSYFFDKFENFGVPEDLKNNIKNFIDDSLFPQDNEKSSSFFETYVPTFVNPDFFMSPPTFETSSDEDDYSTQFFSSVFTSTGEQSYSRTSTTVLQNGKVVSSEETFQYGNHAFDQQAKPTNVPMQQNQPNQSNQFNYVYNQNYEFYEPVYADNNCQIDPSIIILDDADQNKNDILFDVFNDIKTFMEFSSGKFNCNIKQEDSKLNMASKKISKDKDMSNIRLTNKKPSKKSQS